MLSRLILAILLLSSHTLTLRAVMSAPADRSQRVSEIEPCCPLCVPAEDGTQQMGCGCGCGEVQQDHRLPNAPDDQPAIVGSPFAISAPESDSWRDASTTELDDSRFASLVDDAEGHHSTNRFLARIGVWLN